MESRRSRRDMAEQPVGLDDVGQLLHRVARIKSVLPGAPERPQDVLLRPYPSGGAIHELEYYLAVRACAGLAPGFGSLWVPLCAQKPALAKIDLRSNRLSAVLGFGTAAECGITASEDSVWLVIDDQGTLARIDPAARLQQVEPLSDAVEQLSRRERPHTRRGKLEGERQLFETHAEL